jgi:hypothetical protein
MRRTTILQLSTPEIIHPEAASIAACGNPPAERHAVALPCERAYSDYLYQGGRMDQQQTRKEHIANAAKSRSMAQERAAEVAVVAR